MFYLFIFKLKFCREDFVFNNSIFALFGPQKLKTIPTKPVCYCRFYFVIEEVTFYDLAMSDKNSLEEALLKRGGTRNIE